MKVIGLEVNRSYWKTYKRHIGASFISQIFPGDEEYGIYSSSENYALLFCYFNYREPFDNYVQKYRGNCIIIIGPGPDRGTHTDPEPFNPKFAQGDWLLSSIQEIGNTKDFVAIYTK